MQIKSFDSTVFVSSNLVEQLAQSISNFPKANKIFVTVDENTKKLCWPLIKDIPALQQAHLISIPAGEQFKSIDTTVSIWKVLNENGADRKSLMINLGGGVLCDMTGFAASTFKRGMSFINLPTTLLAQVDASIGGKLGINFNGIKNEVGLFNSPKDVIVDTIFLKTLDRTNFLSGYAEMIKHALIFDANHWKNLQEFNPLDAPAGVDYTLLGQLIATSISIKNEFVTNDPYEKGLRKALNFGHTIGHAFESYLMKQKRGVLHGIAISQGMICEAYLSHKKTGLPQSQFEAITNYILKHYGKIDFMQDDYEALYELMRHDKKNEDSLINFTLLNEIGTVKVNNVCNKSEILEALDYFSGL